MATVDYSISCVNPRNGYEYLSYNINIMIEVGLAEYFGIGEAIGIMATLFVILYFSRKQMQVLSIDIETKVLNDLAGRMHSLHQTLI